MSLENSNSPIQFDYSFKESISVDSKEIATRNPLSGGGGGGGGGH